MLPFEQARAFMDENMVTDLAPPGAVSHGWRSVGAVVRPFRWRPVFRRTGYEVVQEPDNPGPFFRQALTFLEVLAVAHAAPVAAPCNVTRLHSPVRRSTPGRVESRRELLPWPFSARVQWVGQVS